MSESSFPVPVWDAVAGLWLPVDFRQGQRVINWPEGFDPHLLPQPAYHDGDHVQFIRDETCTREGRVSRVLLQPENYTTTNIPWYRDADNILYIVTARGHDHRIRAWNILGRFVSLERVSRVLPALDF